MADVGQTEGAAIVPMPGAVRGLAGDQPRYTRELGAPAGSDGSTRRYERQ